MTERIAQIRTLQRTREKSLFLRASFTGFFCLLCGSWFLRDFHVSAVFGSSRLANVKRFLGELVPYPLQKNLSDGAHGETLSAWISAQMSATGWNALLVTFWISILAICLAELLASAICVFAARSIARADPFAEDQRSTAVSFALTCTGVLTGVQLETATGHDNSRLPAVERLDRARERLLWSVVVLAARTLLLFFRSIPEYIWAFMFLSIFGPSALPAILALAIHNCGILGKLNAELLENLPPDPLRSLRSLGASRAQISLFAALPLLFNRAFALFLYRWETCVRESTVLGLLGVVSLGYWVEDARSRNHYDVMFFHILLGAAIVILGDVLSTVVRALMRRA